MRRSVWAAVAVAAAVAAGPAAAADTPAAKRTRTVLLKQPVAGSHANKPLRDVLKAFAGEVEQRAERRVMWTYLAGTDPARKVTVDGKGRPLEQVLDEVLTAAGLESVVVREPDHPRDGWVWVVTPAEAKAYKLFGQALDAVADGKPDDAELLLKSVVAKHPGSKTRAKAEALLEKLNK